MSVDTDMLAIAVLVGGLLVFTAANRDPVEKIDVDPLGQVGMEVDELQPWDPDKQAKKADLGDLNARGQAICAYLRDKTGFMLGIQNFFENGMQNRDAAWLHDNYPDHYALLQTSIEYCNARDTEFRELWLELTSMTGGGLAWMSSNQWIVEVPSNVSNRLRTFFNVSLDSIQRYHQQFVQQMGKQQNALNEALYQQLQQFRGEAFRVIQGQADFFKAFAESQAAQIDRLENQLGQVEMEVDEEGQWLIQNPLENGQIRYQVARNMEWRDLDGNIRARQVVDEVHMPQHLVGGGYGYGAQDDHYGDYNTGQGWDMKGDGGGETDKFGLRKPNKAIEYQQPWAATNPNGARAVPNDQVAEIYSGVDEAPDMSYVVQGGGRQGFQSYSQARASAPRDTLPSDPYHQNNFRKSGQSQEVLHDPSAVAEWAADDVVDKEATYTPANTTSNINTDANRVYTGIQQATSPRGSYIVGKRARTQSFSQGQELPAYKAPRTVEDESRSGGQVDVDTGIRDLKKTARTDTAAITYGAGTDM